MIVADLHIHSRFSRATARDLTPEGLWLHAQLKGVDLLGTGDATHPGWLEELDAKLAPTGDGAYELQPGLAAALAARVPAACRRPVRFLPSAEISSIYQRGGRTRKIHNLILLPDFAAARRLNERLVRLGGNLASDGRPILGLDAKDLLELCLEVEPAVIFIPAHVWTPWFSLFGSKSGFDAIEECFGELTPHIAALETGLSSDPAMNWRLAALDRFPLLSHSDAHSPAKLAREADLFACQPNFPALAAALAGGGRGLLGTLEFFPDEGKYHLDGHRKCGVRLSPAETRAREGRCPVCGRPLTVGVLSRVEELADRPAGFRPAGAKPYESLVPLPEVLAEVAGKGVASRAVQAELQRLTAELGPELGILRETGPEELARAGGPLLAEAVRRTRAGEVRVEGGYDGEFGTVRLFAPGERERLKGQGRFWRAQPAPASPATVPVPPAAPGRTADPPAAGGLLFAPRPAADLGLNPEQARAVAWREGHLIVRAGPGTGKTRLLAGRAAALLGEGVVPERLLALSFTRKAAGELAGRIAALHPAGDRVPVMTFHALGRRVLAEALGQEPLILAGEERETLVAGVARELGLAAGALELAITRHQQEAPDTAPSPGLAPALAAYRAGLRAAGALDLDDLVREAVRRLGEDPALAGRWRGRFDHLLVDEYQDVNPVQVALLRALVGEASRTCAIGDPDQAIYGFRGADRGCFARFGRDFPGAACLGLAANYRSREPILALAAGLMAAEPDPGREALRALAGPGPAPVLAELASPAAEAAWITARVVELLGGVDSRQVEALAGGEGAAAYAPREIAVLYRLHAQAGPLAEALTKAGVPHQVAARTPLAELDPLDFKAQRVSLLSLHAAKGLEWPVVFLAGLEEGLLPYAPPSGQPADFAEERRLLFVGLTRARERLYLSRARRRSLFGHTWEAPSPFLAELPGGILQAARPGRRPRARQLSLF